MKIIFFTILWLSPILNAALYWYRKRLDRQRKGGQIITAGADIHKVVISGQKKWVWFRYFFEDVLFKAILAAIPALILYDVTFFLILFSIGLVVLVLKIGITLYPIPFPVFFWKKGVWTFYSFTFYYVRGFGVFILGVLAPALFLLGVGDLFMMEPILYSQPTVLARWLDTSIGEVPVWVYYALIIPFIALTAANIFYLWLKVTPLLTRFYVEYNNEVVRLISRVMRREIARIDFKKPYVYEQSFDQRRSFSAPGEMSAHIFAQDNKAIAIIGGHSGSSAKETVLGRWPGSVSPVWEADLSGKVSVTYVVTIEELKEFFDGIVKKHWKKG